MQIQIIYVAHVLWTECIQDFTILFDFYLHMNLFLNF